MTGAQSAPFIGAWNEEEIYSRLKAGARGSVHDFEVMTAGFSGTGLEIAVGVENVVDAGLLAILAERRRAVARIAWSGVDFLGRSGDWTGTGFLVGRNLLVTNNHVLHDAGAAARASVEFDYERTFDQIAGGGEFASVPRRALPLDPARLFLTSPAIGGLDYSFVWIGDEAERTYGHVPMSRGSFVMRQYDPVFVIHHPNGRPKQVSLDDTELLNVDGDLLLYAADTDRGSSGAPVIAHNGKLCGLHHAFSRDRDLLQKHKGRAVRLQDGKSYEVANEGIKFSAIAVHLEQRLARGGGDRAAVETVLQHFVDTDSITGYFGARGRTEVAEASGEAGESDADQVVIDAYAATDQDVDIAIWNMDWLDLRSADSSMLRRVATVLADMTQDIWVLDGVPRELADRLREAFREEFGQDYACAYSDADTHPAQPLTVLLYNPRSVEVTRETWPSEIEALWRLTAPADLRTLRGPIFPSFPALFTVATVGRDPAFRANLVPIFIGAAGDPEVRRYAAAQLMTRISDDMLELAGNDQDWLIVGDVDTPLRRTRIDRIEGSGFRAIMAIDRERGGFSYLRGRGSQLSHLFVPRGIETIGDDGGMVTQIDRDFGGRFVEALTSVRPYGVRLSLFSEAATRDMLAFDRRFADRSPAREAPSRLEAGVDSWVWRGLGKRAFLQENAARIRSLLGEVNAWSDERHGEGALPLTALDLAVLIYCEAGFRNGAMDPEGTHSQGERGLLPLPSNLGFWIGSAAPDHDALLPLEENVAWYARYLAEVRNRPVRSSPVGMLYSELFRAEGIAGHPARSAKLLAGVIHGYFLDANYRGGRQAEPSALLAGYREDRPVDLMLAGSGYVHDGTGILANRQTNIDAAIEAWADGS